MSIRFCRWQGLQIAVDAGPRVLRLEMDPHASWDEMRQRARKQPRTEGGINVINFDPGERFEGSLYPSISALPEEGPFISAAVLAQKAKAVDDGIVAALELILDEGTARFRGRATLLGDVQDWLREVWDRSPHDSSTAEAIGLLAAARSLAVDAPDDWTKWPAPLRLRRSRHLRDCRAEPAMDVPLGVYSWNPRLTGLYRQGKALQQPSSREVAAVLARALQADGAMRADYETLLALSALTNPLVGPGLLGDRGIVGLDEPAHAVFPASESPEGRMVQRIVGDNSVPPGFDLIGELIARVGDGRLSLAPTEESGWYDHVLHALEPLILPDRTPEAVKLRLEQDYRDDLKDLFRSLLASARESHVKQLESLRAGGCPLVVSPELTFEPLAEHYRRRAVSYRFIRERLVNLLGKNDLLSRNRLTPRGESGIPLLDELIAMEQLFTGAWAIVLDELGIVPEVGEGERMWLLAARAAARWWAASHRRDPDLADDVRMMVPLFKDIEKEEFQILAIVGLEQRNLKVSFVERPEVLIRDGRGRVVQPDTSWSDSTYPLARPVAITCRTKRLLDRNEFRALCDREGTASAIREALEKS